MMIRKFNILSFVFCFSIIGLFETESQSQTRDFGIWSDIGIEKKIGKWDLSSEIELRTKDNVNQIDRISFQLEAAYSITKSLDAGIGYQLIDFHDSEYTDYQFRSRFYLYAQGKQKFGNLTLSLRERFQLTTKDEGDRIKSNGEINTYRINPEMYWRNRLKLSYNIPHFAVTPAFAFESFYQLNNPDGNTFDKLRYTLSFSYKLNKKHEFVLNTLIDQDIHVENPVLTCIVGFGYWFSF